MTGPRLDTAPSATDPVASAVVPPAWPAEVAAGALARRHRLAQEWSADATVLDLAEPAARRLVRDAAFLATGLPRTGEVGEDVAEPHVPQPASFDVVVSVAALPYFADLPLALRGVSYLLRPEGELALCEPTDRPGAVPLVANSVAAALHRWQPAVAGLHLSRDVPAAVRAEGFTICSIERFTMLTPVWPLRPWTLVRARHIGPPLVGGDAEPTAAAPEAGR